MRTVRRDIDRLRGLGYPVHVDPRRRPAATGWQPGAELPPLLLDDDEAVAVAVGLRTAAGGTVAGIEESSQRALAKLEQVLPARLRRRVAALSAATVPLTGAPAHGRRRRLLDHRHRLPATTSGCASTTAATTAAPRRRTVEPYASSTPDGCWYLVAWDVDRRDWRTFRVDRMRPPHPRPAASRPAHRPPMTSPPTSRRAPPSARLPGAGRVTVPRPGDVVAERVSPTAGLLEAVDAQHLRPAHRRRAPSATWRSTWWGWTSTSPSTTRPSWPTTWSLAAGSTAPAAAHGRSVAGSSAH